MGGRNPLHARLVRIAVPRLQGDPLERRQAGAHREPVHLRRGPQGRNTEELGIGERAEGRRAGVPKLEPDPLAVPTQRNLVVPEPLRGVGHDRWGGNHVAQARGSGERHAAGGIEPRRQRYVVAGAAAVVMLVDALETRGEQARRAPAGTGPDVERGPATPVEGRQGERHGGTPH